MNIYHIPRENRTQQAYFDYVGSLPWIFNGESSLSIAPNEERVTVDGTITGFELVSTFTLPPPPQPITAQDTMTERIKAERDRRKLNGVLVSGKWIHTDVFSRTQWMAMVMMGAALPAVQWRTMDGTSVTTTPTLAGQVFQAVAVMDATVFAVAEGHRVAMLASTDPASYDFSAGWPATFVL